MTRTHETDFRNEAFLDYLFMLVIPGGAVSMERRSFDHMFCRKALKRAERAGLAEVAHDCSEPEEERIRVRLTPAGRRLVGLD
jgi:hypothetical protein